MKKHKKKRLTNEVKIGLIIALINLISALVNLISKLFQEESGRGESPNHYCVISLQHKVEKMQNKTAKFITWSLIALTILVIIITWLI